MDTCILATPDVYGGYFRRYPMITVTIKIPIGTYR